MRAFLFVYSCSFLLHNPSTTIFSSLQLAAATTPSPGLPHFVLTWPTQADHGLRLCGCLRRPRSCPLPSSASSAFSTCEIVQLRPRFHHESTRPVEMWKRDQLLWSVTGSQYCEPWPTVTRPRHSVVTSLQNDTNTSDCRLHSNGLQAAINSHSTSPPRGHFDKNKSIPSPLRSVPASK